MKRYFICTIFIMFLLVVTSCYENPIMEYTPTIIDNGQYAEDLTYHIVSVVVPEGYEDIYYSTSNSSPTSNSSLYSPETYKSSDSEWHEGILVKEGATIYVIGYKSVNGNAYSTFVSNLAIGVSKWDISIVDNGPYSEDQTKHIITITDSSWNGSIYYNFGKYDNPTSDSTWYYAKSYVGRYGKKYSGILVPAGYTIKAISYQTIGNVEHSSNIIEKDLNQWTISIVDNGPSLDDNNKRIVSIIDPTYSSSDIFYTLDGSTPTALSTKYTPAEYQGTDSQTYVGVLLPEATTVKAVADRIENGKKVTSFTSEITIDINKWDINIIDRGESIDDNTKRIVSIEDTKWNGSIFYAVNGKDLAYWREEYLPSNYKCVDGNTYVGILVDETTTIKAVSYVCQNLRSQYSDVSEKTIGLNRWMINIVDNGQVYCDKTNRIVTITDSKWNGDIFYMYLDDLSGNIIRYVESEYVGNDDVIHKGILVPESTKIMAFSQCMYNEEIVTSYTSTLVLGINDWTIDVIDNGQLSDDENIHIITMTDSDWNGYIFYTLDGSIPTADSLLYEPLDYECIDGKMYSGILVSQDEIVNAISYRNVNGKKVSSKIARIYKIGDIGPAGGIVFYDKGYLSDGWRYLELGPENLQGASFGYQTESVLTYGTIGKGKINTINLVNKSSNDSGAFNAAQECYYYVYNDYDDWFLPSCDELQLIYDNLWLTGKCDNLCSGYENDCGYISSTTLVNSDLYSALSLWFWKGSWKHVTRFTYQYVRPIRSF